MPQKNAFSDYRVRVSSRARHVRLQISQREGLVVVAPLTFDLAGIPDMIEAKRAWIEGHLRGFLLAAGVPTSSRVVLPDHMELPALGETWQVLYESMHTHVVGIITETPGVLIVYGAVDHQSACRRALLAWLKRRTREEICPFLSSLAEEHGFRFKESIVRCQKTRWGSCSAKGTISLNCKLLFLERSWVRCILLHELCHTVFLNHSEKFHALLHRVEPECRQIDRQMRKARKIVPPWVEHGPES